MAKNGKVKYFWISLAGLILTALIVLIPLLYDTGKVQANLVATDTALGVRVDGVEEDIEKLVRKAVKSCKSSERFESEKV